MRYLLVVLMSYGIFASDDGYEGQIKKATGPDTALENAYKHLTATHGYWLKVSIRALEQGVRLDSENIQKQVQESPDQFALKSTDVPELLVKKYDELKARKRS